MYYLPLEIHMIIRYNHIKQIHFCKGVPVMTLDQYRKECGWSISEMARQANLDYNTVDKALKGKAVSGRTAFAIAQAISERLGQTVRYTDIEKLKVNV